MNTISTSRSDSHRTTTEESSSVGPNPNVRKGFPVECSCGGQLNLASVRDLMSDGRLCYVCEHFGEEGDHLEKMFDEAVCDEIRWTQTHLASHEDRLSRVEKNTDPENRLGFSREITKIYGMIKALREDIEILDLRYSAVYEKCISAQTETNNGKHAGTSWFNKTRRTSFAISIIFGVFVGYVGQRLMYKLIAG